MTAVKTTFPKPLAGLLIASTCATAGCYNMPAGDPFDPGGEPMATKPSVSAGIAVIGNAHESVGALFAPFFRNSPSEYAELMVGKNSTADERIEGLTELPTFEFGREPPYTDAYATLAASGEVGLVRAVAVRAINRSREVGRTDVLIAALADKSSLVRLEAAKALGNLPDPQAAGPLLQVATDVEQGLDVRLASVEALRYYPENRQVIDGLITLLDGEVFDLVFQARASLAVIFGRDLGYDAEAWRSAASLVAPTTSPSEPPA